MSTEETPKKKSHKVRNVVIGVIAFFVLIAIIQGVSGSDEAEAPEAKSTTSSETKAPAKDKKSKAPAKKKVAKKWTTVGTIEGSSNKESDNFKLGKGDKRVKYTVTGDPDMTLVAVYIEKKGKVISEDGAIPLTMIDKPGKDTSALRKNAGTYYLHVTAANSDYTITVQEKK